MRQVRIPAVFMRGGTSNAIVFHQRDLPADRAAWEAIFLAAIGSPDPNGRQLDGMGGGISSLSKVCVVGPPSRADADIDYTFAQVPIGDGAVDYSANCGNMSSAMGPFALDEGLVAADGPFAEVRIHNTNTGKIIHARFALDGGAAAVDGAFELPGVAGLGAPVRLSFLDPAGASSGRLLPTGNVVDTLSVPGLGEIEASLVDASNACVFVRASDLGLSGNEAPERIDADASAWSRLAAIREAASVAMGLAADRPAAARLPSVPKVGIVAPPLDATTLSGAALAAADGSLSARMASMENCHRALPLTGALCLGVAARIAGSIPAQLLARADDGEIALMQPSGLTVVEADVARDESGQWQARSAGVYRTARRLFEGHVLVSGQRLAQAAAAPLAAGGAE